MTEILSHREIAEKVSNWMRVRKIKARFLRMIRRWHNDKESDAVLPLPFPGDRDLTLEEKYTILAAIHDSMQVGGEINPWRKRLQDGPVHKCKNTPCDKSSLNKKEQLGVGISYVLLKIEAEKRLDQHRLAQILEDVTMDILTLATEQVEYECIDDGGVVTPPLPGQPASIKRPPEIAFTAWRLRDFLGITNQTKLAEKLTEQGFPATQGQVSRWLKQVEKYLAAGNVLPPLKPLTSQPESMDPSVIDMGKRQDGLTPRQRHRRSEDSDD